jgi:hypothetical protein
MASVSEMADVIEEYVCKSGGVSFVELERELGNAAKGEFSYECPVNSVWWAGMSREFCEAIRECRKRGNIQPKPVSPLIYYCDGKGLRYPVGKQPPKGGYKEPHWIPIIFNKTNEGDGCDS